MKHHILLATCLLVLLSVHPSFGGKLEELPLLSVSDIVYNGAFRLPATTYGPSSLNYSEGPLEYNGSDHSIFIVGHAHHQNIAEFQIPTLSNSTELTELKMAGAPKQVFTPILDRATGGNPQALDRIGGMEYFSNVNPPQLLINTYEYYDAPGDNTQTTLIARDSDNLATCTMDGYYTFEGGAGHTSGWISPIPSEWQTELGGTHITGQSSGIPIISRTSVGPSAFSFSPEAMLSGSNPETNVPTTTLLDFSLTHPLHDDLSNDARTNNIWTHISRVIYGLIVPETRTYLTLGESGGHESGVCYKCTQDDGNLCGGYCARAADDYYHYYWLWDVKDLLAVKNGEKQPHEIRPYDFGEFITPFATNSFGGGTFDPNSKLLYLTVQKADREQGTYSNPPVVVTFSFSVTENTSTSTSTSTVAPPNYLLLK